MRRAGITEEYCKILGLSFLSQLQFHKLGEKILKKCAGNIPSAPVDVCGIRFPNILGVAAGLDKNATCIKAWSLLGFGHVEVGTVTSLPQYGNAKPRIFKLPRNKAIINRMGFPNEGAQVIAGRLRMFRQIVPEIVIGINVGKKQDTPLESAADDYLDCMRRLYPHGDYLVINVSSPNTPGLRTLQHPPYLNNLLESILNERDLLSSLYNIKRRPLFLKISPDLTLEELKVIVGTSVKLGVDGIVATNTTSFRTILTDKNSSQEGGLSGLPLQTRSTIQINRIKQMTGGRLPVIGVGGVFNWEDAKMKLDAGASLVQMYTGFVYGGPRIPGRILRDLYG